MEFYKIYHPKTASPFASNETYREWAPCEALRPYIRCFWGSEKPVRQEKTDVCTTGIVTPDTCMDIIFYVDFTNNRTGNRFCGIDDRSFFSHDRQDEEKLTANYAIRFYAWSAVLFAEESMCDVRNAFFDAEVHFSGIKKAIEPLLFDVKSMAEFSALAEKVLLQNLKEKRENRLVEEAVAQILFSRGTMRTYSLAKELHTSSRQLERQFRDYIGVSPKNLTAMVRYQYLWDEVLFHPAFDVMEAVWRYGYTDQAHLLHEFKKFHSMNLTEAKRYALKDVAFLQEK